MGEILITYFIIFILINNKKNLDKSNSTLLIYINDIYKIWKRINF